MIHLNVILFNGFETLDAFGPVEVMGRLKESYIIKHYSLDGGIIESSHQVRVQTLPFTEIDTSGILLIPGGMGTRSLIHDKHFISQLKVLSEKALYVLTVCTGSALLAKTNLLNGLKATSNKLAFSWVASNGTEVNWIKQARWVNDGKYYTSSGVSAGIDMTLGFISDIHGKKTSQDIANAIEYIWNANKDDDPFAILQGI